MASMEAVPTSGDLFVIFKGDDVKPRTYPNWRRRHWVPTVQRADVGPLAPTTFVTLRSQGCSKSIGGPSPK